MPLGKGSPTNEGAKMGTPIEDVILPLLARLACKWLLNIGVFSDFFRCWAVTHISRVNYADRARDRTRQPALNVGFNSLSFDFLHSAGAYAGVK